MAIFEVSMLELSSDLFAPSAFILHTPCYLEQPLVWSHALSDALIAIAYYSIPVTLVYFVRQRQDLPFNPIFLLFSASIVADGTTHLLEIWAWGPYWLSGLIKAITAAVSLCTAASLIQLVPKLKWVQGEARMEMQGSGALHWDMPVNIAKQQEERLRLLESVVIHANDAVLVTEAGPIEAPGPPILYANAAFTHMTGYSLEEVLGKTTAQFLHGPKTDQAVLEQIRVAVKACQPILVELLNYRKDGAEFWVELSVVPIKDETGYCTHWISIQRDITERKRQEERLRLLESVVIHANDAVVITKTKPVADPDPGIIYANAAFTRMTGYSVEEVLSRSPRLLQGAKTDQAALDQIHKALKTWQPLVVELLNYRKDGTEFWVELSIVPVADETGWYTHWISIQRDITERKQSELALQQSEARHRALLDAIPDLMLRISHDGTHLECKAPKDFFTLVPAKEHIGKNEADLLPSELAHKRQHYRKQALATGDIQVFDYQLLVRGASRYEEARIVKSAEDEVLVIVRDITARKKAEHQIQASLAEKEVLLREIHHRVKNNLQVILSLLRLQAGYINDPQALEMFQASQNRVRVMALIHEQLYQSKDLAKINLAAYIEHLVSNIRRSYSVAPHPVKFKINISEVFLSIDQVIPCGLIINELVANALKHSFPKQESGEVDIELYPLTVEKYLLTIRDNGIGLPTDLDLETTHSLGLKLVDRLVRQLRGSIKFHNREGAVFQIEFSRNH